MTLRKQREPWGPGAQTGALMPHLAAFDTHWDHQLAHSYGVLGPASHTSLNVHGASTSAGDPHAGGHGAPPAQITYENSWKDPTRVLQSKH